MHAVILYSHYFPLLCLLRLWSRLLRIRSLWIKHCFFFLSLVFWFCCDAVWDAWHLWKLVIVLRNQVTRTELLKFSFQCKCREASSRSASWFVFTMHWKHEAVLHTFLRSRSSWFLMKLVSRDAEPRHRQRGSTDTVLLWCKCNISWLVPGTGYWKWLGVRITDQVYACRSISASFYAVWMPAVLSWRQTWIFFKFWYQRLRPPVVPLAD